METRLNHRTYEVQGLPLRPPVADFMCFGPPSSQRPPIWDGGPMCSGARRATIAAIAYYQGRDLMPRIRITTEPLGTPDALVVLDERIATSDLGSDHFAAALIARIGWALADADDVERRR